MCKCLVMLFICWPLVWCTRYDSMISWCYKWGNTLHLVSSLALVAVSMTMSWSHIANNMSGDTHTHTQCQTWAHTVQASHNWAPSCSSLTPVGLGHVLVLLSHTHTLLVKWVSYESKFFGFFLSSKILLLWVTASEIPMATFAKSGDFQILNCSLDQKMLEVWTPKVEYLRPSRFWRPKNEKGPSNIFCPVKYGIGEPTVLGFCLGHWNSYFSLLGGVRTQYIPHLKLILSISHNSLC